MNSNNISHSNCRLSNPLSTIKFGISEFVICLIGLSFVAGISTVSLAEENSNRKNHSDIPQMQEQAARAGISHIYDGPWEFFVGGGGSALDCNADRRPDLVLAGGTNPLQLFVNKSPTGGELRFEAKNLDINADDLLNILGTYALDLDNDGHTDLVLLRLGENIILKGGANCTFTKANRFFTFDGGKAWTTSFAATFEKEESFPTLAFGNYVDRDAPGSPWGTCHDNILLRPQNGDVLDYGNQTELSPGYCSLSMLFTDWNKSGVPSLRVSNDRQYYRGGEEQLWHINKRQPPRLYTRDDGWGHLTIWGMGIAEADINGDGFPEYALTSMGDTKLQSLDPQANGLPVYTDIAWERGATAHRPYTGTDLNPSTGWHSQFEDFNNDGILDLFIAKGNVEKMPDFANFDPDNLLLGQANGKFVEAGDQSGIALASKGRGAVIADFNMDGMLDLVVINRSGPTSVFRNLGAKNREVPEKPKMMGNWLQIELQQKGSNRNAVGALISIKSGNNNRTRRVRIGGGHASGSLGFIHVGLGVAERAMIRIKWPDGSWSSTYRVFANQFVVIKRDDAIPKYWFPE
ncbi:MAG: CRTAC1 family protein [Hyphomicrobiales bacterium]|nr:CRTAC1 family protein [Hyphomicrobiales bacterium]